jgi:hypothetical protein
MVNSEPDSPNAVKKVRIVLMECWRVGELNQVYRLTIPSLQHSITPISGSGSAGLGPD